MAQLVARSVRDAEVVRSNRITPTSYPGRIIRVMLEVIITSLLGFGILLLTEWAAKHKKLGAELSRKIPHVVSSITIASWPFFISMRTVFWLGLMLTIATVLGRMFNLFPNSRSVDRRTWGDPLLGLGITVAALLNPTKWIFVAAILTLGLADATAALVGKAIGKHRYKIKGHYKTIEGSLAFMIIAVAITAWVVLVAPAGLNLAWPVILWLPFIATLVEGITPYGLDNLLIPIVVVVVLNSLQAVS